jgi:hypothetical protein
MEKNTFGCRALCRDLEAADLRRVDRDMMQLALGNPPKHRTAGSEGQETSIVPPNSQNSSETAIFEVLLRLRTAARVAACVKDPTLTIPNPLQHGE